MPEESSPPFGVESTIQAVAADVSTSDGASSSEERYTRRGTLGRGGMGAVDWVWDRDLLRDLAVKRVRDDAADRAQLMPLFLWEARVTAALSHPNIVPVYDLGTTSSGELYFSMKRVEGDTLASAIREVAATGDAPTPLGRRLRPFVHIANAVAYAHERGVVHRDLKPGNVMCGAHGEVVVMDWGLARVVGDDGVLSPIEPAEAQGVAGTPRYMAPEQARGEEVDQRADVYSLGVILYELTSGRSPYASTTVGKLLDEVKSGGSIPIDERVPGVPSGLAAVIDKAMATEPAQRYANAKELREDVERFLDGLTPVAEDASLARRAARFYMHQDPRFARLRVVDIDLLAFGCALFGVGLGLLVAWGITRWAAAAMMVAGLALCLPFFLKCLRPRSS